MKKPNITEGEWEFKSQDHSNGISDPDIYGTIDTKDDDLGWSICAVWEDAGIENNEEANAQAISAVPDMIDALMVAKDIFETEGINCDEIENALKKAGVEL